MIIKDLELTHFGKFHNKKIEFLPGLNIIYGRNEVGKSTIHAFIRGMLFGIEKSRGRASKDDRYLKYEPWENAGGYEGKMRFEVDGHIFRIERSFLKTNKYFRLINETMGKELSNPKETLETLLGGLNESNYTNTISIEQLKSATDDALVDELKVFATNIGKSKNSEINLIEAQESLRIEKKRLSSYIVKDAKERYMEDKEESNRIEREIQELSIRKKEHEVQIKDCVKKLDAVRHQLEADNKDSELKKAALQQQMEELESWIDGREEEIKEERVNGRLVIFALIAIAGAVVGGYLYAVHQMGWMALAFGITAIAALLFVFFSVFQKRRKQSLKELEERKINLKQIRQQYEAFIKSLAQQNAEQTYHQLQEQLQMWKDVHNRLDWELDKKQELLLKIQQRMDRTKQQLIENDKYFEETKAIELAIDQIQKLAGKIHDSFGSDLNKLASEFFARITKGKYHKLVMEENASIYINTPQKLIPIESVSRGTIEQIYLSIRLAAAKIMWKDKQMPLIFDDVFAYYDDERLSEVMDMFQTMDQQIILFTCHKREDALLIK